jgi:DNA-directed RNA polymerase alpha subunit
MINPITHQMVCPNCKTTIGYLNITLVYDVHAKPLDSHPWSTRVKHAFERADLKTFGDLCHYKTYELLREPNFGRRSLKEVEDALQSYGLNLRKTLTTKD